METIPAHYLVRAETWLVITTLFYFLMNGAQLFETAVLIPRWTAHAPASMQMFRGKYGINLKTFWIIIHSVHEITFILAIIFCWNLDIRNWLLLLFAIHFAVRVWTMLYFAPRIISFQQAVNGEKEISDLAAKAKQWRRWNYLRVALFLLVSLGLVPLCMQLLSCTGL